MINASPNMLSLAGLSSLLEGLTPDTRFALIIVVIGCATGVLCVAIGVTCSMVNSLHRRRLENELKREMLDRGMTAAEIAMVIESAAPPDDATQR